MTHVHHHDTQTVASRFCGHCGTEVSGGYTVCAACGANYRRKGRGLYIGILLGVLGVQALVTGEWEGAVVLLGVGFFVDPSRPPACLVSQKRLTMLSLCMVLNQSDPHMHG